MRRAEINFCFPECTFKSVISFLSSSGPKYEMHKYTFIGSPQRRAFQNVKSVSMGNPTSLLFLTKELRGEIKKAINSEHNGRVTKAWIRLTSNVRNSLGNSNLQDGSHWFLWNGHIAYDIPLHHLSLRNVPQPTGAIEMPSQHNGSGKALCPA